MVYVNFNYTPRLNIEWSNFLIKKGYKFHTIKIVFQSPPHYMQEVSLFCNFELPNATNGSRVEFRRYRLHRNPESRFLSRFLQSAGRTEGNSEYTEYFWLVINKIIEKYDNRALDLQKVAQKSVIFHLTMY